MKKYILISLLIVVLGVGHFVTEGILSKIASKEEVGIESETIFAPSEDIAVTSNEKNFVPLPASYQIKNVPFTSQAPFANWDELHDEACEEASLIILKYYLTAQKLTLEVAENEIQKMVSWEIDYFGSHKDLTAAETIILAEKYYDLDNLIKKQVASIDEIKQEISQNHLVIIPTAGRLLGNPNFRSPGPVYHMLVISGYDQNGFTTQDVGTRRGQNYYYQKDVLFNAIHDWTGNPETINQGAKNIIILSN